MLYNVADGGRFGTRRYDVDVGRVLQGRDGMVSPRERHCGAVRGTLLRWRTSLKTAHV